MNCRICNTSAAPHELALKTDGKDLVQQTDGNYTDRVTMKSVEVTKEQAAQIKGICLNCLEKLFLEAEAYQEKYRVAASVLCGGHIGVPQRACPVCIKDEYQRAFERLMSHVHIAELGGHSMASNIELLQVQSSQARTANLVG